MSHANSEVVYAVVSNDEGQYSIWPADKLMPLGWKQAGMCGSKRSCLGFIAAPPSALLPALKGGIEHHPGQRT